MQFVKPIQIPERIIRVIDFKRGNFRRKFFFITLKFKMIKVKYPNKEEKATPRIPHLKISKKFPIISTIMAIIEFFATSFVFDKERRIG